MEKPLCTWDTVQIITQRIEFYRECPEACPDPDLTDEELFSWVAEDYDLFAREWEYLCDYLTELLEKRNPGGHWHVTVENFGWRGLHGEKTFIAYDGETFLRAILPQTDCTFRVYGHEGGRGFAVQNFHHDSPLRKEWYYVIPMSDDEDEYED